MAQLAAKTDDPVGDISDEVREATLARRHGGLEQRIRYQGNNGFLVHWGSFINARYSS